MMTYRPLLPHLTLLAAMVAGCSDRTETQVRPVPAPQPATRPVSMPAQVSVTPAANTAVESRVAIHESRDTLTGTNLRMSDLVSVAYRTPEKRLSGVPLLSAMRVVSERPLPDGRYDVRVYVQGGTANDLRGALRSHLAREFGLTVRKEIQPRDVLVLTAPQGRMFPGSAAGMPTARAGQAAAVLTGDHPALLAEQLEERIGVPVVDETGQAGRYALELHWPGSANQPVPADLARAAVREQLGLELSPARRNIEVLVVSSAR